MRKAAKTSDLIGWNEIAPEIVRMNTHLVGGDFNRDSDKVLGDNKLNVGTHGRSTYDSLMHTGKDLKRLGARVEGGYASDHEAVVARYRPAGR